MDDFYRAIPGYDPFKDSEDFYLDEAEAENKIFFFENALTHVKGDLSNKKLILEDWERAIIGNLFGWKRKKDNLRRYRECLIFVPRKNGKSLIASGICLCGFFCDGEGGAEIYCAAADRDQAKLIWDVAKKQIQNEPGLMNLCETYMNSIVIKENLSTFKAISSDANTKHGFNAHIVVVDELHAQRDRELVDVLKTSMGARKQPLMVYATTSDYERESICNEVHKYACDVRDGIIEDHQFLPVIYEASKDDDWTNPEVWAKANPNLGVSVSEEFLAKECEKAKHIMSYQNTFKRLYLNIKTESLTQWMDMEEWDNCNGEVDIEDLEGQQCFAGLDLASTRDLSAFVLYFPDSGAVLPFCFVPEDGAIAREKRDRVPYTAWKDQGLIDFTEGNVCDYGHIRNKIKELYERFNIREIAYDRWGATQLATDLQGDGFDLVQFGQGFASMSSPTKELDKLIAAGEIKHGGHKILRWCANNVMIESDAAGNIKPSKKKSSEKIDPIVALVMAIGCATVSEGDGRSVYEDGGIFRL